MAPEKYILIFFSLSCFLLGAYAADPLCVGLDPGQYIPFPHETNCSLYYECHNGNKTIQICDDGLYYNPTLESCDFPEASGCVNAPVDPLCVGLDPGEYITFPHETNCSLYYECHNGQKSTEICQDDLYYNPTVESCDFPENSGCVNGGNQCKGIDIDYLPHPSGICDKYIECYEGDSYEMSCPADHYFNSVLKKCVDYADSDCGSASTEPPYTTPHPICWGVRPNTTVLKPYEGDCSKYWECDGATLTLRDCPSGLLFNPDKQLCDFADNVHCEWAPSTSNPFSTTPNPLPVDPRCSLEPEPSYWSDPDDCSSYIECFNSNSYHMSCPSGLYFSQDLRQCVSPRDSECGRTTPPTRPTSERPTNWTPDDDCHYEGELLPYPGDCTKYYECAEGRKVQMNCPENLWWNDEIKECDYPYQSGCPWGKLTWLQVVFGFFSKRLL